MTSNRFLAAALLVAACAVAPLVSAQTKAVLWPASAIKWTDNPAVKGARTAVLWGDPTKGAYGALKQIPAGATLAPHTHKNDSRVVMVKGTVTLDIEGKKTALPAGSYTLIPGGVPHSATCGAAAACEYFEEMSGAFDSTPAGTSLGRTRRAFLRRARSCSATRRASTPRRSTRRSIGLMRRRRMRDGRRRCRAISASR